MKISFMAKIPACSRRDRITGFSLLELTVAMLLGLLVSGSALSIFISNRQLQRATESISNIQEKARAAFDLIAQDVREAGGNPCGRNVLIGSVVNNQSDVWWASLRRPLFGYGAGTSMPEVGFGKDAGQRVDGTDAVEIKSVDAGIVRVIDHDPVSARFRVNNNVGIRRGDVAVACDGSQITVFQVTDASFGTDASVYHSTAENTVPGNCSAGLGFPALCRTGGTPHQYPANSNLGKLHASRWYIGNNAHGGTSLYQSTLRNTGGTVAVFNEEVVDAVDDMQIRYLLGGATDYVAADAVPADRWGLVRSVRIHMIFSASEAQQSPVGIRNRDLMQIVTLRNRLP
ncbi:MAG: PilW family protein [Xanthomonadaceae bacterium]|nr:PilW family protein [Xanthomonadaceae bacterium]MDP2184327.1 PilW family protein [Xanthomonadales bacterium]MDZ4116777.1 PilW family protein [Xanthomonadaceae bacterium]MDZ4377650.1 PilW family protein [Xanthomonadaceae bacterium]